MLYPSVQKKELYIFNQIGLLWEWVEVILVDINIAKTYAAARGSQWFLVGLVLLVLVWLTFSFITGFDKDHGLINLCLSAEASISLAFFALLNDQQDAKFEAILEKLDDKVDDILEEVEEDHNGH